MAKCPFFEESMWNGNKCKASVGKDRSGMQIIAELIYYHHIQYNRLKVISIILLTRN